MSKQITRWSPDTCDCVIEYAWDDSISENDREHSIHKVINKCQHHLESKDEESHFRVILTENSKKNIAINKIMEKFPNLTKVDQEGNISLKEGSLAWSYSKDRILSIESPHLDKGQHEIIKTIISSI